jgi:hypothetical protein
VVLELPVGEPWFVRRRVDDTITLDELTGSDIAQYVGTMQRLRDLPVEVVHGGHEASFGRERLVEICNAYLKARSRD